MQMTLILTASESAARVITPSPLAGEGDSAVQQQKWVRVAAATPHRAEFVARLALPSPAKGEGTSISARVCGSISTGTPNF